MEQKINCPRCTLLNHPQNDECVSCRLPLNRRRNQGNGRKSQRHKPRGEPLGPGYMKNAEGWQEATTTKGCGKSIISVLETIWIIFMLFTYTLYTIIVTWTADTIFQSIYKITMYLLILLGVYCVYYSTPFMIKKFIQGLKWIIRKIKTVETNPCVWIVVTLIIIWCSMLTAGFVLGYEVMMVNFDDIRGQMAGIQLNVTDLQIQVVNLKNRIVNVEIGVDRLRNDMDIGFAKLGNNIKALDAKLVNQTDYLNKKYSEYIENDNWIRKADTYVRETMYSVFNRLSSRSITRAEFGLGCFLKGTKIQIDKDGNTVNIEDLIDGDYVYSPTLNRLIKIKILFLYGEETGTMYEITTKGSLSVIVTETHPMKICNNNVCNNIAAKDIFVGNWTQTINGNQEIISVEEISVENALVYNFMLDIDGNTLVTFRDVIANGIISLDLEAQKQHH
eukprot:486616_1